MSCRLPLLSAFIPAPIPSTSCTLLHAGLHTAAIHCVLYLQYTPHAGSIEPSVLGRPHVLQGGGDAASKKSPKRRPFKRDRCFNSGFNPGFGSGFGFGAEAESDYEEDRCPGYGDGFDFGSGEGGFW